MNGTASTTTDNLAAARRANDEKVIRERGPLAAVMSAPSEDTAVRRAQMILATDNVLERIRRPFATCSPAEVVQALAGWHLLNTRPEQAAS